MHLRLSHTPAQQARRPPPTLPGAAWGEGSGPCSQEAGLGQVAVPSPSGVLSWRGRKTPPRNPIGGSWPQALAPKSQPEGASVTHRPLSRARPCTQEGLSAGERVEAPRPVAVAPSWSPWAYFWPLLPFAGLGQQGGPHSGWLLSDHSEAIVTSLETTDTRLHCHP